MFILLSLSSGSFAITNAGPVNVHEYNPHLFTDIFTILTIACYAIGPSMTVVGVSMLIWGKEISKNIRISISILLIVAGLILILTPSLLDVGVPPCLMGGAIENEPRVCGSEPLIW